MGLPALHKQPLYTYVNVSTCILHNSFLSPSLSFALPFLLTNELTILGTYIYIANNMAMLF